MQHEHNYGEMTLAYYDSNKNADDVRVWGQLEFNASVPEDHEVENEEEVLVEEDAKFLEFLIYSTILKKSARPRMSLR